MSERKPRILVLGGGPGGLVASRRLAEILRGKAEIVLVEKTGRHLFPPSLIWVMTGERSPEDIAKPLDGLKRFGIKVIKASVERIDPSEGKVETSEGSLTYDYLIVALGSIPRPESIEGGGVCSPWTIEGALRCRELLSKLKRGAGLEVVAGAWSWPYKCPPAPFEVAFLVKYILSELRGLDAKVRVVHFWKEPMEPFGPSMVGAFKTFMNKYGIEYISGFKPVSAENGYLVSEGGDKVGFDIAVMAPPHEPPKPVRESELADDSLGGYMKVDKVTLRHPKYDNVFGVGDVISPALGIGMAGVFAHFEAEYVASQIADEVLGTYAGQDYNRSGICVMDLGYVGAAVYCDFKDKILGRSEYPRCVMMGGMKAFRIFKYAFEKLWFARWL